MTLSQKNNKQAYDALMYGGTMTEQQWRRCSGMSFGAFAGASKRLVSNGSVLRSMSDDGRTVYSVAAVELPMDNPKESNAKNDDLVPVRHERQLYVSPNYKGGGQMSTDKITGFFSDFAEWEINIRDSYGQDTDIDDDGVGRVTVRLSSGDVIRYRYHDDDDGGLIFS